MPTRRDFLKSAAVAVPAWSGLSSLAGRSQGNSPSGDRFLFGASVYPDIDGGSLAELHFRREIENVWLDALSAV